MANNVNITTPTQMRTGVPDYSVASKTIDSPSANEIEWTNPNFTKYLGYYKQIPELKSAIDAYARWTVGKGWSADSRTTNMLNLITGWGEDSFQSIMWNMIVMKKINGDAYAEIIKVPDSNLLVNIKTLNPSTIKTIVSPKGIILRYEEILPDGKTRKIERDKILHFANDRVANEIHGTSTIEACQWVIDARNEAMADKRRILHRSTIRVIEVDSNDSAAMTKLKTEWAEAIKYGEVLLVPKDNVAFPNVPPLTTAEHSEWIRYLENFFYQALGISKSVLGGSQEFTEASSKMGIFAWEQGYKSEARELESDILSQLGINVKFEEPASLQQNTQMNEAANTGQMKVGTANNG